MEANGVASDNCEFLDSGPTRRIDRAIEHRRTAEPCKRFNVGPERASEVAVDETAGGDHGIHRASFRRAAAFLQSGPEEARVLRETTQRMPRRNVLVIGSGPIIIGQAAEFDYAGVQACRALREQGHRVILVNSNPATIMTDPQIADAVYLEPLTVRSVEAIIERERPDALLPTLGGQTGLNLAVELSDAGVLDRCAVEVLGTPIETIRLAEDRERFKSTMLAIGEPVPPSVIVTEIGAGIAFAAEY